MSADMILFTRTYDLLRWLLPRSEKFPKQYRSSITQRLRNALLDFQEVVLEANAVTDKIRLRLLRQADGHLAKIRLYVRLAFDWQWFSPGQYRHVSEMINEIGRLLGGWIQQTAK